jgi:hypothetical protein
MPFSAYNSNGVRLLSAAHSETMGLVRRASGHSLSEVETSAVSTKLVNNLMKTHDSGSAILRRSSAPRFKGFSRRLLLAMCMTRPALPAPLRAAAPRVGARPRGRVEMCVPPITERLSPTTILNSGSAAAHPSGRRWLGTGYGAQRYRLDEATRRRSYFINHASLLSSQQKVISNAVSNQNSCLLLPLGN